MSLIKQIVAFPEDGMGYTLVDFTLFDGRVAEQVLVCNSELVCFYDGMKVFSESDIRSIAPSQV
jgi:hypothetical protein